MIIVLRKKIVLIFLITLVIATIILGVGVSYVNVLRRKNSFVVVLDAGHGGRDSGVIGVNSKIAEKEVNLAITYMVKAYLEKAKIKVILTRKNDDGLYGKATANFKKIDMQKRKEIINQTQPDVVVSIHCNRFPSDSKRRGGQAFFEPTSEHSKELAFSLQASLNILNKEFVGREFSALKGDYYILKCSKYVSAIVECGFMSNPEDDRLLQQEEYRDRVAYKISSGIIGYLNLYTSYNNLGQERVI